MQDGTQVESRNEKLKKLVEVLTEYELEKQIILETVKEVKADAIDEGLLSKDEMKILSQAIRLIKSQTDMDKLTEFVEILGGSNDN